MVPAEAAAAGPQSLLLGVRLQGTMGEKNLDFETALLHLTVHSKRGFRERGFGQVVLWPPSQHLF